MRLIARERIEDSVDMAVVDMYFGPDAKNGEEMKFGTFKYLEDAGERLDAFKGQVTAELERRNLVNLVPTAFKVGGRRRRYRSCVRRRFSSLCRPMR